MTATFGVSEPPVRSVVLVRGHSGVAKQAAPCWAGRRDHVIGRLGVPGVFSLTGPTRSLVRSLNINGWSVSLETLRDKVADSILSA